MPCVLSILCLHYVERNAKYHSLSTVRNKINVSYIVSIYILGFLSATNMKKKSFSTQFETVFGSDIWVFLVVLRVVALKLEYYKIIRRDNLN